MSMLKVNLVEGTRSIPLARESTAGDAIKVILNRLDIPEEYAKYCALMYVMPGTYGLPLVDDDLVPIELFSSTTEKTGTSPNSLHFRVLIFPLDISIDSLDNNFRELIFEQAHRLVITRTWIISPELMYEVAAYHLMVMFGPKLTENGSFGTNQSIILKSLDQLIASYGKIKQSEVERQIATFYSVGIAKLRSRYPDLDNNYREIGIKSYLTCLASKAHQYGCAMWPGMIDSINGTSVGSPIEIGLNKEFLLFMEKDQRMNGCFAHKSIVSFGLTNESDPNAISVKVMNGEETSNFVIHCQSGQTLIRAWNIFQARAKSEKK